MLGGKLESVNGLEKRVLPKYFFKRKSLQISSKSNTSCLTNECQIFSFRKRVNIIFTINKSYRN